MKSIYQTWVTNHGWLLSGTALLVGAVACMVWYLDWVPLVFLSSGNKSAVVSQSIQKQNGILVAQVVASEELRGQKGKILLYISSEDHSAMPTYQERFTLDDRGMASLLLVVPAQDYSMIAFLDANDNGQLDFVDNRAVEEFRLPKRSSSNEASEDVSNNGPITLPPQAPCLCVFDFSVEIANNQ